MKVVAFGASTSSKSINKALATYAAGLIKNAEVEVIDLNDFSMPIYSQDIEAATGIPQLAKDFFAKLQTADLLVVSFAEHNGGYTAAYKNIFDWTSRVNQKVYDGKPMLLLSTSPGPGAAKSSLGAAVGSSPFFGATVKGTFSLPSFYENFDLAKHVISNEVFDTQLKTIIQSL